MDRYNRNILIKEIGLSGQKKLQNAKVLVAGCGGLASGVIANLSGLGIGTIGLIDNDIVELTNLNRQFIHKFENIGKNKTDSMKEWINTYNPNINVHTYNLYLDQNNYKDIIEKYDIIIDCFDSFKSKFLLNDIAIEQNKPLIHGGASELEGQVMTILPNKTACLRCLISDIDEKEYIPKGIISPVVTTIASIQTMEMVKVLLNIGNLLTNQLLIFDALTMDFRKIAFSQNKDCPVCI